MLAGCRTLCLSRTSLLHLSLHPSSFPPSPCHHFPHPLVIISPIALSLFSLFDRHEFTPPPLSQFFPHRYHLFYPALLSWLSLSGFVALVWHALETVMCLWGGFPCKWCVVKYNWVSEVWWVCTRILSYRCTIMVQARNQNKYRFLHLWNVTTVELLTLSVWWQSVNCHSSVILLTPSLQFCLSQYSSSSYLSVH